MSKSTRLQERTRDLKREAQIADEEYHSKYHYRIHGSGPFYLDKAFIDGNGGTNWKELSRHNTIKDAQDAWTHATKDLTK